MDTTLDFRALLEDLSRRRDEALSASERWPLTVKELLIAYGTKQDFSFRAANLQGADLQGANLRWADLQGADLQGADLRGAILNWSSHTLIGYILWAAAGDDYYKRALAGAVYLSYDWCWKDFLAKTPEDILEWGLGVLEVYVKDGDKAPDFLHERARKLAALDVNATALADTGKVAQS